MLLAVAQSSQPENPHDVNNKDRPAVDQPATGQIDRAETGNSNSVQNKDQAHPAVKPDLDRAEKENPHHTMNKDKDRMSMSSPSGLIMKLHAANMEEIDAGQMAMKNGGPRAQEYGRMLADDHKDADKKLRDLAMKRGVKLDDSMGAMKSRDAHSKLDGKSGADFDKAFANAMVEGHEHVIAMVKSARASCKDADLCNMLDETLPVLQHHLKAAEDLRMPAAQGRTPEKR
ncbi:MAG: DUF4142 domain-containing protein [Myxococcales bacterium]|nr:DUF4142 domain-containing protein [Myxococcales bacterium]